jgi:hypothetical protein
LEIADGSLGIDGGEAADGTRRRLGVSDWSREAHVENNVENGG